MCKTICAMKVVVVDDEPLARQTIESLIIENIPDVNVVAKVGEVNEAIEVIKSQKPDLVFLDVDIIGGSGFDVLNALKPIAFKVIFITAHQQYALRAIKFSAFDYILKPVGQIELINAVIKAKESLKENSILNWKAFFENLSERDKPKRIILKTSDSIHLVNIGDIIRCEADNNYSTFYLINHQKILISKGLKEYEEMLVGYGFFRVHQSHLVNLKYVSRFDKKEGGILILSDKSSLPVSQRKKQKLLEVFEQIK